MPFLRSRPMLRLVVVLLALAVSVRETHAGDDLLPGGRRPLQLEQNGRWIGNGVAFSPYRDGQAPERKAPSEAEIAADLRLVARYWHFVRVYDSSAVSETAIRVIEREHLAIKVILGAWLVGETTAENRAANAAELANAIRLANTYPEIVIAVSAGNEAGVAWSDHHAGAKALATWVRQIRSAVRQPVTCADDYNFWNKEESREVGAVVDFIILHAYALWNGQPLDSAMAWTARQYDACVAFHRGVPVIIGETGWATSNDPGRRGAGGEGTLMKAEASVPAQAEYLRQHFRWVSGHRVPTILFEAFDEAWKGGGATTPPIIAEKHWGVFDASRRPKASFEAAVREFDHGDGF